MTPYILALAALALLLARTVRRKPRGNGYQPKGPAAPPPPPPTSGSNIQTDTHGSTLRHTTAKHKKNRKKEDEQ